MGRPIHPHIITTDSALGGLEIQRSLRFNPVDTAYLHRTPSSDSNKRTFTFSGWIKLSSTDAVAIFSIGTNVTNRTFINTNSSRINVINEVSDTVNLNLMTTAKLRDLTSWYHLVVAVDSNQATASNRAKIYLNGTQLTDFDTETYFSQYSNTFVNNNQEHRIGNAAWTDNTFVFNGYMAECHFIDGQQLTPDSFGYTETQTEIWRPKKFIPTGPNNGTTWSGNVTTSNFSSGSATDLFDGNFYGSSATISSSDASNNHITLSSVNVVASKVGVVLSNSGSDVQVYVNGSLVGTAAAGDIINNNPKHFEFTFTETTVSTIKVQRVSSTSGWQIYGVSLNGVTLLDGDTSNVGLNGFHLDFSDNSAATAVTLGKDRSGNANDYTPNNFSVSAGTGNDSVLDTPSNNFCTLHPLDAVGDGVAETINQGNLMAKNTSGSYRTTRSTYYLRTGKWYWEVLVYDWGGGSGEFLCGVVGKDYVAGSGTRRAYSSNGQKYIGSGSSYGATYTTDDVIGVALDLDHGTLTFYKNNVSQGVAFTDMLSTIAPGDYDNEGWTPMFNGYSNSHAAMNFGQQPFTYTPPAGHKTICSNNLLNHSTKSILNPKKHFDCLLYTGDDKNYRHVTGLDFTPDFVWLKNRDHTSWHLLANSMHGFQNHHYSNSDLYSSYDLNGNGFINPDPIQAVGISSGGFSPNGQTDRNTNNKDDKHVAWCWKGGSPNVETPTSGSVYFPESNNYLDLGSYTEFQFGTGDYTIEMFVYHTLLSGQQTYASDVNGNSAGVYFYKTDTQKLAMYYSGTIAESSSTTIPLRKWVHVAASRSSGTLKLFQDGIEVGSGSDTTNLTATQLNIGDSNGGTSGSMHGYISNVRVLKGTGLYTSNFTVPTSPLTNITNTVFLGCQSHRHAGLASVHPSPFSNNGTNYSSGSQLVGALTIAQTEGEYTHGGPDSLFDGRLSYYGSDTYATATLSSDNYIEWTPTSAISYTSKVEVWCYAANGYNITNYYYLNGGSGQTFTGGGSNFNSHNWITIATGSGTLTSLKIRLTRSGSASFVNWGAIRIDGCILVNDVTGKVVTPTLDMSRSLPVSAKNPFDGEFAIDGKRYLTAAAAGLSGGGKSPISASVNTKAGFSMISYVSSSGNESIYHGLNQAPQIVITKDVDNSRDLGVYYNLVGTNSNWMKLNTSDTQGGNNSGQTLGGVSGSYMYLHENYIQPAANAFANGGNDGSDQIIAYMWHSVPGYSKMGSYKGNNNGSGPFISCGFKPAWLMVKCTSAANGNWLIYDRSRSSNNVRGLRVAANIQDSENQNNTNLGNDSSVGVDFLSDGFKIRSTGINHNNNGERYIYMAFAEKSGNTPYQVENNAQ